MPTAADTITPALWVYQAVIIIIATFGEFSFGNAAMGSLTFNWEIIKAKWFPVHSIL